MLPLGLPPPGKVFTLAGALLPVAVLEALVGGGQVPDVGGGVVGELVAPEEVAAGMTADFVGVVACWKVDDKH